MTISYHPDTCMVLSHVPSFDPSECGHGEPAPVSPMIMFSIFGHTELNDIFLLSSGPSFFFIFSIQISFVFIMLRLHCHIFTAHFFCLDPTHFIRACKCAAHFPRRAFTRIFRVEKLACQLLGTSAENASKSVHLRWQISCVAGK